MWGSLTKVMLAKPKNKKLDSQNKHSQTHAHKDYHVSFLHTHTHTQKTKKKKDYHVSRTENPNRNGISSICPRSLLLLATADS